jgi:hypothetical protein
MTNKDIISLVTEYSPCDALIHLKPYKSEKYVGIKPLSIFLIGLTLSDDKGTIKTIQITFQRAFLS